MADSEIMEAKKQIATMVTAPKVWEVPALFNGSYQSYNGREPD